MPNVDNIDLNKLGRGGGGSRGPDYIPYNQKGRDPFARTSFNTGIYWLGGFLGGGSYGLVQGWRGATSSNYKIRFNSVMNGISKQGSKWGNMLGLIGKYCVNECLWLVADDPFLYIHSIFAHLQRSTA
jgi:hypothetical protein